jgi:hypothetical protein
MKLFNNYSAQMQLAIARNMHALAVAEPKGTVDDWHDALLQVNPQLAEYPEYPAPVVAEVLLVVQKGKFSASQ